MAGNKKISDLPTLTGASVAADDLFVVVDVDAAVGARTRKITLEDLGSALGTSPGSYQPHDASLDALSGQDITANSLLIGSGDNTVFSVTFASNKFPARASTGGLVDKPITDFILTLMDDATAAEARTTLGVGTGGGTTAWGDITGTLSAQTDLQAALDAKVSDVAYNATTWNGVTTVAPSKNAVRDYLNTLGTAAFTDSTAYDASGAAAAAQAASQPLDATLTALAGANWAANTLAVGSGADTVAQVTFAANTFPGRASTGNLVAKVITDFGLSLVDDADASTARTTLGLGTLATQSGTFSGTSSGTNTGDQTTVSGNAGTATALQNARTIGGVSFDGTTNITVATATGGFTVSGGNLALGTNSLTMTGSIASTGSRVTKGWFTDLESTNAIVASVTGNAATVTTNANLTGPITSSGNATTIANSVSIPGSPTTTTQSPGDNSTKVATTAYVDAAVLGQNFKEAAKYATTAALPTVVYANGSSGVGATLTGVALGALSLDSNTPSVGDRVLVKNQASTFQNGIYTVTAVGSGAAVFVMTRTTDADQALEWKTGDSLFVTSGTVNASTMWAYNGIDSPVMGTDTITFAQTAGPGTLTSGNGITVTGLSIAIDTSVTVDKTTVQTLTNKTLTSPVMTSPTLGTPSSGTLTNCTFPTLNQNTTGSAASLSVSGQTGLLTVTGLASTNRIKTVRDAADTILELGGSYTPTGTWTSLTMVTPVLGTPTSGNLTNCTALPVSGITASTSTAIGVGSVELGHATDTTIARSSSGAITVEGVQVILSGAALGTPASGTLTNCTGLPASSITAGVLAASVTLGENFGIVYDAALSADGKYSGLVRAGTAGATLTFGDVVYLDAATSRWLLIDANAASTAGDVLVAICVLAAANNGDPTTLLLTGFVRADAKFPTFTIGAPIYLSETAGLLTSTQPSTADVVIRRAGFAWTADEVYWNPSNDYVTHT